LGKHLNRARLHDVNGVFREPISILEAEQLVDSGAAMRLSRLKERPLRVKLLVARPVQPAAGSGCTSPASITAADMLAAVGITKGPGGVNWSRVNAARAKIEAFRVDRSAGKPRESSVAAVTSASGCSMRLL
jgi:hypothetical protein